MHHRLADSKVAGRDALVEGRHASLGVHPLDALPHGHLHLGVVVQLHSRLHKPNGIRCRGGDKAGTRCTHDVHQWRVTFNKAGDQVQALIWCCSARCTHSVPKPDLPQTVERVFGLRVGAEVNGTGWGHAHEIRTQTLEQGAWTLILDDVPAGAARCIIVTGS